MGRKKRLQNVSNLCFGAKDVSDLLTDQHTVQALENFIRSLLNHLKFELSSLELLFLWSNKNLSERGYTDAGC